MLADINLKIKMHEGQLAQLRKEAREIQNQARGAVIEDVRAKIAEYGLTASDLKFVSRARVGKRLPQPTPAKYRSPTGETWSGGRGRKPRWVKEALNAGKSLIDFEIK